MTKRFTRKTGLSFFVKIKKLDGRVVSRRSPAKRKVYNFLQAGSAKFKWIYLKVTYKPGLANEGKYSFDQKHELLNAWQCFTEENLIKDVITNY
jgi:hypothetical protein